MNWFNLIPIQYSTFPCDCLDLSLLKMFGHTGFDNCNTTVLAKQGVSNPPSVIAPPFSAALYRHLLQNNFIHAAQHSKIVATTPELQTIHSECKAKQGRAGPNSRAVVQRGTLKRQLIHKWVWGSVRPRILSNTPTLTNECDGIISQDGAGGQRDEARHCMGGPTPWKWKSECPASI